MRFVFYFLILTCSFSFCQKRTIDVIAVAPSLKYLVLDFDAVFNIKLSTSTDNEIIINSISEGEYANHFILTKKLENNSYYISGDIGFTFPDNQDKLSAHKVHAISLDIVIPKYLQTEITSDIANFSIQGDFKSLSTNSQSGNCYLSKVTGQFVIKTINGNINLITNYAKVDSSSKTGVINQDELIYGNSNFVLKTSKGNINIVKSN